MGFAAAAAAEALRDMKETGGGSFCGFAKKK
jgi:hypothetical protein